MSLIFNTTKSILCEPGCSARLGELATAQGMTRALVVSDAGLKGIGLLDGPLKSLEAAGVAVALYTGVVADPPESNVHDALAMARDIGADGVIGLGGGSPMDVAKLVAYLMRNDVKLADIYGVGLATGPRLPLIQVPTTAGTGSEVTPIAIITTGESQKMGVVSPPLLPDLAVLDADLTLGLPPHVTAATGVDAMVHAIEAFASKHKRNPISNALAREALALLWGNIRAAWSTGADREARSNMLLGACLAGMAFANAPVAAVHALAYPIGGHFHVPHGLSNSLVLCPVLRFNAPVAAATYAEIAPIVAPDAAGQTAPQATDAMIQALSDLIDDLKIETKLSQVGINHNHLPMLAEDAMKQQRLLVNNPRDVAYEDALAIYEAVL